MNKIKIQEKLFYIDNIIKSDNLFLINNIPELKDVLNHIEKSSHLKIFYFYKSFIQKLLEIDDEILIIDTEYIKDNILPNLFYLSILIQDNIYVVNYSYDFDFIKELYEHINNEKSKLTKFVLNTLFLTIIYNFNALDDSFSEKTDNMLKEIEEYLKTKQSLLDELDLNLDLDIDIENNNLFNIEDIYIQIIMSLIRNKKLENYEYAKNIMEQLDMENIELTEVIYEKLKDEFDQNSDSEYINNYKIINSEDLIKENNINFYYILMKYIFKNQIYIYNIQFLLETKNNIVSIEKKDPSKLLAYILKNSNLEYNERLDYILKKFLDSKYYFYRKRVLDEILKYFKTFLFPSKSEEINIIESIIVDDNNNDYMKYLSYYEEAIKWNKRYDIIKYVFDVKNNITEDKLNEHKKSWELYEEKIKKKTSKRKLKQINKILTYFTDEKNMKSILEIFKQDEVDYFVNIQKIHKSLEEIRLYYKNYLFESKANDIIKINKALNNEIEIDTKTFESEYLKDLETAKQMNIKYDFFKKIFKLENIQKEEKIIQSKIKEWDNIKKMLEEKNIDNINDDIKIELFKYFSDEYELKKNKEIISEESYEYLMKKKTESLNEILKYYQDFFPQSKKEEIELIKNGNIQNDIIMQYSIAKKNNLRKPLIHLFINNKTNIDEIELKLAVEKWTKIENEINNKQFKLIELKDKLKLINYIKDKNNILLDKIFNKHINQDFLNFLKSDDKKKIETKSEYSNKSISTSSKTSQKSKKLKKKVRIRKTGLFEEVKNIEIKQDNNDLSLSYQKSEISTKDITVSIKESEKKEEENKTKDKKDETDLKCFLFEEILKKELKILFSLKIKDKKELYINDIICSGIIRINENDLYKCKEFFSKNDESKEYKIFEFIDEFKEEIKNRFNSNYNLIVELKIEKTRDDFSCTYIFFPPKGDIKFFKESEISINKLSEAFELLLYEINDDKYKIIEQEQLVYRPIIKLNNKNSIKNKQKETNSINKDNEINQISTMDDSTKSKEDTDMTSINNKTESTIIINNVSSTESSLNSNSNKDNDKKKTNNEKMDYEYIANKYQVLIYIKKIGEHYDKGKRIIAEYIKEFKLGPDRQYISVGSDKKMKLYNKQFMEINNDFNIDPKIGIYDIEQVNNDNLEFITCIDKDIYLYKDGNIEKQEISDITCVSIIKIKSKNILKNSDNYIIAGRNGVVLSINKFKPKEEYKKDEKISNIKSITYRGLIRINHQLIALTSNKVLQGGEDKLIIYDVNNNMVKMELNNSFIASINGMSIIKMLKENKEKTIKQRFLLCACKQYLEEQQNGILIIQIIKNNDKDKADYDFNINFYPTQDFEVYCFCPLATTNNERVNSKYHYHSKYFLVGGFNKLKREGQIKLFELIEKEENDKNPKIRFLQDIDIDFKDINTYDSKNKEMNSTYINSSNKKYHYNTEKIEVIKNKNFDNKTEGIRNDIIIDNNKKIIIKEEKKEEDLNYFKGAISSIIQSTLYGNIIVSCYDGKIYLLSKPNMEYYEPENYVNF